MNYLLAILLLCAGCAATVQPTIPPTIPPVLIPPTPADAISSISVVHRDTASPSPTTNILSISIVNPASLPTNTFCDVLTSTDLVHWVYQGTLAMTGGTNMLQDAEANAMMFYQLRQFTITFSTNL